MQCATPVDATPTPTATATPAASTGERRQLTVVFCDLVGSTELSQRLDVEQLREVIRAYQHTCVASIEHHGGHVAQYLGDGILAYFGYPIAAEDDVERALRATLEMQSALQRGVATRAGPRPSVRVGIHTGPVIVSELGAGARREHLALGATSNVAARLQALATPGTVVASADTLAHVPGLFVTTDLGRQTLKGIDEPVHVLRVERVAGVRHRLDARELTPLVGREQELESLHALWRSALGGSGRLLHLSGDAGMGKSRLVRAFRDRIAAETYTSLEGYCAPRAAGSAFGPVIELLSRALGFSDGDTPSDRLARLERAFDLPDLEPERIVPHVARLLALPPSRRFIVAEVSPEHERERTLTALEDAFLAMARPQPLLLIVEDLHWCDPSTLELFERLSRRLDGARLMIVTTARPTFVATWIAGSDTVALAALAPTQIRDLALSTASFAGLPAEVIDQIVARADGVPLFAEELARAVDSTRKHGSPTDDHEDRLTVPATLQDSLMSRLDRLGDGKRIAQLCATLGREFEFSLLEEVSDEPKEALVMSLGRLVDAGILAQQGVPPRATYSFRHALLQDIAYHSQLEADREKVHARIARLLESQSASTTPEAVAEHYREGGLVREAARYYRRAGDAAYERWANAEAVEFFRKATTLEAEVGTPVPRRMETRVRLADSLARLGRRLEAATTYLEGIGVDPAHDFALRRSAGYNLMRAERIDDGLRELEALCRETGLDWPRSLVTSFLSVAVVRTRIELSRYRIDPSRRRALSAAEARRMDLCLDLALGLWLHAPIHTALFAARFTLLAFKGGDRRRLARAFALEAGTQAVKGSRRGPIADELLVRAEAIANELGDPSLMAFVRMQEATVLFQAGEWGRTREACEQATAILQQHGGEAAEADVIALHLHQALYYLGDLPRLGTLLAQEKRVAARAESPASLLDVGLGAVASMLLSGDPDDTRQRAAAALSNLASRRFGLPDLMATQVTAESLLYEGRGRDAARLMRQRWAELRGTFVFLSQLGFVSMWDLGGRCELAAAAAGDADGVAGTRRAIRKLERAGCAWGTALAKLMEAGMRALTEGPQGALATYEQAVDKLDAVELSAYRDAARHRMARLRPASGADAAIIESTWTTRGIADPLRMFNMLAPGHWPGAERGNTP